jgi:1,2-diacylglycerol 3-alpha-glucosyltransferase
MHIVVVFINIGFYHAARLRGALQICDSLGWKLSAIQLTNGTQDHPWAFDGKYFGIPVITLVKNSDDESYVSNDRISIILQKNINYQLNQLNPSVLFLPGWSESLSHKVLKWSERHYVPAVVLSESKYDDEKRSWWKEKLKSWLYIRKFKGALVGGDAHANYAKQLGIPKENIFKGYDVVDNEYFAKKADEARTNIFMVQKKYSNMPTRPYFIAVFRFIQRKNAVKLLAAYFQYYQKLSTESWDLVICGDGEQKEELAAIIQENKISDRVHLVGFLKYHEIGHWYGAAEAFIHAALQEQWGLVINEACAAGLPVLCSKTVGAVPDLVKNGVNGFLFDPNDIDDISNNMYKMHKIGNNTRNQMGKESQKLVSLLSIEVFGKNMVSAAKFAVETVQFKSK